MACRFSCGIRTRTKNEYTLTGIEHSSFRPGDCASLELSNLMIRVKTCIESSCPSGRGCFRMVACARGLQVLAMWPAFVAFQIKSVKVNRTISKP